MHAAQTLAGLAALFLTLSPSLASAEENKADTTCQLCGMDAAQSETEFILHVKEAPQMHACCVNCTRRIMDKLGEKVTKVTTLDYRTHKQVAAADAFYVAGSQHVPKGSMTPFVFAFGARQDADDFKARHGGNVLTFDGLLAQLKAKKGE
jgi:nitrous oxide reductase accessory protein NosL